LSYLYFVTLNTGSADRIAPPSAIVTQAAALDLARALRDGVTGIARHSGFQLQALTVGPALLCTVSKAGQPLATFGVAARSRGSANLWQIMHETSAGYGLASDRTSPPPAPWCGVRVEPGFLSYPDAAQWLASYEVDVATAWIEKRHQ